MSKNQANPTNSSFIQMCLDAAKAGHPEFYDLLLQKTRENDSIVRDVDEIWKTHKYPDSSLNWVKLKTFENCRAIINLSHVSGGDKARAVLMAMVQSVNSDLLVQAPLATLSTLTKQSKPTVIKSIDVLSTYGFIAVAKPSTSKEGTVYMVNPSIVTIGATDEESLTERFNQCVLKSDQTLQPLREFLELFNKNSGVKIAFSKYIDDAGNYVFYNSWLETKKEAVKSQEKKPTQGQE